VNLLLLEVCLQQDLEVSLLDADVIYFKNPQSVLFNAIAHADIALSRNFPGRQPLVQNINVGVMGIAPTELGLALVREWMRVFALLGQLQSPDYQLTLLNILARDGKKRNIVHTNDFHWKVSAQMTLGRPGHISVFYFSLFDVPTVIWITLMFITHARAANVEVPMLVHLLMFTPLAIKLTYIKFCNFIFAKDSGCQGRSNPTDNLRPKEWNWNYFPHGRWWRRKVRRRRR
jgi:hypothetical protein